MFDPLVWAKFEGSSSEKKKLNNKYHQNNIMVK